LSAGCTNSLGSRIDRPAHRAVRMFFRYLQLEGILRENLAELLGSQKLWERIPEVLSPTMVQRFLECTSTTMTLSGVVIVPC
jgi:site-specific recombinase XerD